MVFNGIRVLVLEGYSRQSLPLIKAFRSLGCEVSVLCNSKFDVAYVSKYTTHKILGICDREKVAETTQQILALLKTNKYDMVVPTVDFSASVLAKNKSEFSKYTKVLCPDEDVYDIAQDKNKTMKICMENDIPCPKTLLNISKIEQIDDSQIGYPMVVKPAVSYGAIGFKKIESRSELETFFEENSNCIDKYVFQEFIPQTGLQYECAMFIDNNNQVKTSLVFSKNRWFPVEGGSSTLNITVENDEIVQSCTKLLQKINWRGAADIDLIYDPRDNVYKIMEINPRVSGSVKICFVSGVDQARQMLELAYGQPVTKYKTYDLGKRLRMSQTDVLWFIKSPNRFKTKPSWFSMRKTYDQTFSWDDPLPWFAFLFQGLKRYKKEMKKR